MRSHRTAEIYVILLFLHVDPRSGSIQKIRSRIQEVQKHTDPDPEQCNIILSVYYLHLNQVERFVTKTRHWEQS
jgi:hypothetical protein